MEWAETYVHTKVLWRSSESCQPLEFWFWSIWQFQIPRTLPLSGRVLPENSHVIWMILDRQRPENQKKLLVHHVRDSESHTSGSPRPLEKAVCWETDNVWYGIYPSSKCSTISLVDKKWNTLTWQLRSNVIFFKECSWAWHSPQLASLV